MATRKSDASKRRQAEALANIERNPEAAKIYTDKAKAVRKTVRNSAADALKGTQAKGSAASTPDTKAAKKVNRLYSPSPQQRTRSK